MTKYVLRPTLKRSDFRDIYRIYVPASLYFNLRPGPKDLWILEDDAGHSVAVGRLSQAQSDVQNKVVQVSQEFKDLFGLSFSNNYGLRRFVSESEDASQIVLVEQSGHKFQAAQRFDYQGYMRATLQGKMVSPKLLIENVRLGDETRSFQVKSVQRAGSTRILQEPVDTCICAADTKLLIEDLNNEEDATSSFYIDRNGIFGMHQQLDTIDRVLMYHDPAENLPASMTGHGLLLLGPKGTGKTLLADRIASLPWRKKVTVTLESLGDMPAKALAQVFSDCIKCQPALIIFKNFQVLKETRAGLEYAVLQGFEAIKDARVLVLVELKNNMMSEDLSSCFMTQISMPSIDEDSRRCLIQQLLERYSKDVRLPAQLSAIMAEQTPGYTGLSLQNLTMTARSYVDERGRVKRHCESAMARIDSSLTKNDRQEAEITLEDLEKALNTISQTMLAKADTTSRRIVRWSDIGGQQDLKEIVEMHFEWPSKYPEKFQALKLPPSKGMLLYGPPGCSKTMTALALATEAKLNFIPIKGPELLTKYLGESESKLRSIFQKARNVAPCVVFFDEIDSINSGGSSDGGVKLTETLLNELDGVDSIGNVFVLAATNKPWALDRALLRSGRFDTLYYVKLPDASARSEIFRIQLDSVPQRRLTDSALWQRPDDVPQQRSNDGVLQSRSDDSVPQNQEGLDYDLLAKMTEGCSGAEIVGFCSKAKLIALKEQIDQQAVYLTHEHFDKASVNLRKDTPATLIADYEEFEKNIER